MASGVCNLLKPPGMTSRQAVSRVARLTGEKAGHAGTLDPQACGVLPILLGKATRLFDFVAGERKQYLAEIRFGMETDTQDAEGVITQDGGRIPALQEVLDVLPRFLGDSLQEPPAYSAKKIGGVRAHKLARAGDAPAMAAQPIQVHAITHVTKSAEDRHLIRVVCSKGTYIRTLCRDIGRALGTYAHMSFLLREGTSDFSIDDAITLEELEAAVTSAASNTAWLTSMDTVLKQVPVFTVHPDWETRCLNGVPLPRDAGSPAPDLAGSQVRVICRGALVGLGTVSETDIRINTWLLEGEST